MCRPDLGVTPGVLGANPQAVVSAALARAGGTVGKGRGDVVHFRLVNLLLGTLVPVLKDDGDLHE